MRLSTLVNALKEEGLLVLAPDKLDDIALNDIAIDHLSNDSRKVGRRGAFVAIRGGTADGHMFIDKAVINGAVAIVCEAVPEDTYASGTSFVRVHDSRRALAVLATRFYGNPSRDIGAVGITGTNGKTTTSMLVYGMLSGLGYKSGLIGTVEVRIGDLITPVTHTTPDAIELNGIIARMKREECRYLAMEVSSHALHQHRVYGIEFDIAVFTNLSRDHLDYHPSYDDYFLAKRSMFDQLSADATAVFNIDDELGAQMVGRTSARKLSFGMSSEADIRFEIVDNNLGGIELELDGHRQRFRLVGRFNAYNIAAAYASGVALGIDRKDLIQSLAEAPPAPGRFEQMSFEDGRTVIVDYAHTPDALESVLKAVRETRRPNQQIWCVFGCGGNRDTSKRRVMGSIAETFADHVIVTSDNPRTEEPEAIMNDIRRGMNSPERAHWVVDRREAIRLASVSARPGDVVLVAGKGHEPYQIIGDKRISFDDRAEVAIAFGALPTEQ